MIIPVWVFVTKRSPPPPSGRSAVSAPVKGAGAVPASRKAPATRQASVVKSTAPAPGATAASGPLEDHWGIQVSGVGLTEGSVLELLYKVVDAQKAASLANAEAPAYLVEQDSGTRILLGPPPQGPASAHSRARSRALMMWQAGGFPPPPSKLVAGKTYSVLLPNPGSVVKTGSKVAVVIGDFQSAGLVVN